MSAQRSSSLRAARAGYAYDDVADWSQTWRGEAAQRAKGLPVQIRTQGLMVAVATLMNADGDSPRRLAGLLAQWLLQRAPVRTLPWKPQPGVTPGPRDLLDACAKAPRAAVLAAQREAIAVTEQVKLYAQALWGAKE